MIVLKFGGREVNLIADLVLQRWALSGFVLFQSQSAFAQDTNVPKNKADCMQGVADAKLARENEPDIGPKAGKIFDGVIELAEKRCEQSEFVYANELLNLARGMTASE